MAGIDHRLAERHRTVERLDDGLGPLHDNATEEIAFLGDADCRVRWNLLFQAETENNLIEPSLAVLLKEFDGSDQSRAGEGSGSHAAYLVEAETE
jgi:hypothetical protein